MADGRNTQEQRKPQQHSSEGEGNSLDDASDEMVKFMEQQDEPGHAGRGDGG